MSNTDKNRVCPVELAGGLDNKIRRLFQNPYRILKPYILPGMKVFELGCGPGYFTPVIAELAGESGRVVAADLQDDMLNILKGKIAGTLFEKRIEIHKCGNNNIGYNGNAGFIYAFYVIHEIPDKERLFSELYGMLDPGGRMLIVEPPFHVSGKEFSAMMGIILAAGFRVVKYPKMFPNRSVLLEKPV